MSRKDTSAQNNGSRRETVIEHVLTRLRQIGITDVFGVAGDFAFPIHDAICKRDDMEWIGCSNELNASYAADGYARVKGIAALSTTYGVGELSAIAGVAGAYAESLPIFHLVGMPSLSLQESHAKVHHTLGNGEFHIFSHMAESVVCAQAIMTPQNAAFETERLIAAALFHRKPVYMAFPADCVNLPIASTAQQVPAPASDPTTLEQATEAIVTAIAGAKRACILPGILVSRAGLKNEMQAVVDASGLPFASMFMDKAVLDEQQANYVGIYNGALMNEQVRQFVEGSDWILGVGTALTDFNTGAFTSKIDMDKTIGIGLHSTRVGRMTYPNIEMKHILAALAIRLPRRTDIVGPAPTTIEGPLGKNSDPITAEKLYPRFAKFLKPSDILVAETGTSALGMMFAHMPVNSSFFNQSLWGAIGWATPSAFGAAVAAPERRVVLITGEGSHQLTAQEISQFARRKLRPIVFVLNNDGYLVERLLCEDPEIAYNDIAQWNYADLPHALGCNDWFTVRVTTCGELDAAIESALKAGSGAYIEVVTGKYEAPPLAMKFHESVHTLYSAQ